MNLTGVAAAAAGEFRSAQLRNLYRTDFTAWKADVLGFRTYQKMQDITEVALFGEIPRTAIKSSNGTSKSFEVSSMVGWAGSVFEPDEAISIITAPSLTQIDKVIFKYLKSFKNRAKERGFDLPGWINEQLEWQVKGPEGSITLAYGRKPATGTEVSTFQGVRSEFGRTYVFADEAGGLSKNIYTAVEAVMTGGDSRFIAIGNPDDAGTEWQQVFEHKKYEADYNRFTISSFDLPTFTGEMVYPDDPEMQARMLKSLTQVSWVEHKKRVWGEKDARYLSKVLGEFPKDGGNGFFSQTAINRAYDTVIEEDLSVPLIAALDVARWGKDESVIASNRGGLVRVEDSWGKTDLVSTARRANEWCEANRVTQLRIDSTGVGGGVFDILDDPYGDFADKSYEVVGWDNGSSSPDITQWSNKRAYSHDSLRSQMMEGLIDLDIEDEELREQLTIITYKFTSRGGIQITPKDDLKTEMGGSPDRLDAVIMAATDMSPWIDNPWNEFERGDTVLADPAEVLGIEYFWGAPGTPL